MEQVADWQITLLMVTVSIATALSIYAAAVSEGKGKVLCEDCRFNNETDCLKADRPNALICTAYRSVNDPVTVNEPPKIEQD